MKGNGDRRDVESKSIRCRIKAFLMPPYSRVKVVIMGAGGVVAATILTAVSDDLYLYFKDVVKNDSNLPPWVHRMSLEVDNCYSGSLSVIFDDYNPIIKWGNGADRLVICATALIEGEKETFPVLFEERFPECLSVSKVSDGYTISTNLDSPAVCRAPYRYNQDSLVDTSLPNGLFICMPGYQREESQVSYRQDDVEVPVCNEEDLKEYKFL